MKIFFSDIQVSCNEVNICHPNARCVPNPNANKPGESYMCQCDNGFSGDGFQCAPQVGIPPPPPSLGNEDSCDVVDNCGQHATCIYDDEILQSVCVCDGGYRGDGFTCTPLGNAIANMSLRWWIPTNFFFRFTDECSSASDCDRFAQCVFNNRDQRYQCECGEGFFGDGKQCVVDREFNRAPLDLGNYVNKK